jgi:hypothetical protein
VAPPAFLFQKIKDSVEEQENENLKRSLQPLYAHAVIPPPQAVSFGAIMNRIKETDELNTFKPLRDYEVKAPISFARLMEIIKSLVSNQVKKPSATVISLGTFKRIAAAAAILLTIISGYFIFQKNNPYNASNNPSAVVTTPTVPNNITATPPTIPVSDSNTATKNTLAAIDLKGKYGHLRNNIFGRSLNPNAYGNSKKAESLPIKDMTINGAVIPIIDNDYLATFTSFDPNNLPLFLQADNPVATSITVDQYTSITISEGMGAMMKKMYKTRKSGKPTRRARKQREKLEKWKKIDSEYFNQNSTSNPLDPFDLGNFILNK